SEDGNQHQKVKWQISLKDSVADLFSAIEGKLLTELDFSKLDHIYEAENVISSFNHSQLNGYKYVMAFNPGAADDTTFNLNEFYPGVYTKTYFDKIFYENGYSYTFDEMYNDDVKFDKLINPY